MPWWTDDQERWEREVKDMTSLFPTSQWFENSDNGPTRVGWEIIVEPMPPHSETMLVLSDLDKDGFGFEVDQGGMLRHSFQCHAQHNLSSQLQGLVLEDQAFLLELTYRNPPGHPVTRCIEPKLSKETIPDHPHFYGLDIICPLFPPDGTWKWNQHTAAEYLTHVVVWLVKASVWSITRDMTGEGIWLGSDVGHSLDRLLRTPREAQCACGSGRVYKKCCLSNHLKMQARQRHAAKAIPQA